MSEKNAIDKLFDAAEAIVGGLEASKRMADGDAEEEDKKNNVIDAEFTEEPTPIEKKKVFSSPSGFDIKNARFDLYGAYSNLRGVERFEFKTLIMELYNLLQKE